MQTEGGFDIVEYRRRVALSATRRDIELYNPPKGIDCQFFEFDDYTKTVLTQMVVNSETPTINERRTMEDIDAELARLKVAYDRVRRFPSCLEGQQTKFECNLDELKGELDKLRHRTHTKTQSGFGDILI